MDRGVQWPLVTAFMLFMPAATAQMPAALVQVEKAKQLFMAPTQDVPSTVYSLNHAQVAAEVNGRLLTVAEVGTPAARGEVLARLDDGDYAVNLQTAEAVVSREQAKLAYLRSEVKRLNELSKSNDVSKTRLEQMRSERNVSQQELLSATTRLKRAQFDMQRLLVKAPFDGVVTTRIRQPGEWVETGDDVVTFANPDRLEIRAQAPATSLPFLKTGQHITIRNSRQSGTAVIKSVVAVGDRQSGLYTVVLEPMENIWRAGQTLRAALPAGEPSEVLAVPRDALVIRRDGASVYRIADNKAQKVSITTGVASGKYIEAIGKLKDGDMVVIRGSERLLPGQDVILKPAEN